LPALAGYLKDNWEHFLGILPGSIFALISAPLKLNGSLGFLYGALEPDCTFSSSEGTVSSREIRDCGMPVLRIGFLWWTMHPAGFLSRSVIIPSSSPLWIGM
tara:strand:+ start:81 stop:386 length:306 start_codon:yes stop_codon:yes gene_type:complete